MLAWVLDDDSPSQDDQRFVEDIDGSMDGFLQHRGTHAAIKGKLAGKWRTRHDAIMQQPTVRAAWAATNAPHAAYMADQPGRYAAK